MVMRRSASPGVLLGAGTNAPPEQPQEHPGDQVAVLGPLTSDAQQSQPVSGGGKVAHRAGSVDHWLTCRIRMLTCMTTVTTTQPTEMP
jgi:hypothetical protein